MEFQRRRRDYGQIATRHSICASVGFFGAVFYSDMGGQGVGADKTGVAYLLLFLSGLCRHLPNPMLGEMVVGSRAVLPLYLSLFVEKH